MMRKLAIALLGVAAMAGGVATTADAAKHKHAKKAHAKKARSALGGDTKTQAEAAALEAVPGGTVTRSHAAKPDNADGAAYVVDVTKEDGSRVKVLEDSAFKVLSVEAVAEDGDEDHGPCPGHHRGDGDGPGNPAETELTGDAKTQAEAAALEAVPGGTVTRSSTEDADDPSGAAYEVHVTKADGSRVEVLEDAEFKVLSAEADDHGPGGRHPGGPRG